MSTDRIAKWFRWVLLAPGVLPLIYWEGLLYPLLTPKTLLFRGLFIAAVALFTYLALSSRTFYFERLRNWKTWIPGAILVVAYATSLIGIDFYHSFWSVFNRGDGLLTLTSIVGFFYLILLYADRQFLQRLLTLAAWVGSTVALYALFQWLQEISGMNIPLITEASGRLGATLGNAAYLAAYLGMTFFAALAILKEQRGRWKRVLQVGAGFQFVAIILTATRGTILALLVAGFLTALYLAWKGEGRVKKNARFGLAAVLVLAALFFVFREPLQSAPFEPVRRIASISITDATVASRLFILQNVFAEGLKQPLTGYGAEHISVVFNRVYDPSGIIEEWFDRSHNAYLDYFVQFGIFGLALFVLFLVSFAHLAWRLFRVGNAYAPYILLLVIVYAVQNLFLFDTATTLWFLFAIFAALLAYPLSSTSTEVASALRIRLPSKLPILIGIVILVLLYPVVIQPLRANLALAEGYVYHVADVTRATEVMRKGLSLNIYADLEYGYQLYTMYTDRQATMLTGNDRVTAYRFALETLKKNYERYPYDARTSLYLAHVLDLTPPEETQDEQLLRETLARSIELSPKHIQSHYLLANISLKKGDAAGQAGQTAERNRLYREGIAVLESYAATVPLLSETRYIIANLYMVMGDRAAARKWADEGLALYKGEAKVARRALGYYLTTEDWQTAIRLAEDVVAAEPANYEMKYDLAKFYFLSGNRAKALEIVEMLRREKPGLVETDPDFLQALGG